VTGWEYLIVSLHSFKAPTHEQGASSAVTTLNGEGRLGWEAIGLTALADGGYAVLMKRPIAAERHGEQP
jgi:hypothetical protein